MEFLIAVLPGVSLVCALIIFALAVGQFYLFKRHGKRRSRDLAIFCLVTGWFALCESLFHSRVLPMPLFQYFCEASFPVIFLSSFFYLKSMTYFIIVPSWLRQLFYWCQAVLAGLSTISIIHLLVFGSSIFFDEANKVETGNYFMNTFSLAFGKSDPFLLIILSLSSALNILLAFVMFLKIQKSSKDFYLVVGLSFTILASGTEMLLLPFTVQFFVPVLFLSNFFEAFRMNYLVFTEASKGEFDTDKLESYRETSIDEKRISRLAVQLSQLMETEKLYRDPNLSLARLAAHLKIPAYLLTQVLRFGLGTNYYEYVSELRIEDVKVKMKSPEFKDMSIIEIAYSSGFNSKSSFNVAFKKQTKMTPKQYRQT